MKKVYFVTGRKKGKKDRVLSTHYKKNQARNSYKKYRKKGYSHLLLRTEISK